MLDKKSLQLVLVNPLGAVIEKLHKSKTLESFKSSGLYLTIGKRLRTYQQNGKCERKIKEG
ncbi:unnamed protein product [Rhodiola kirilowii]